MLFNELLNWFKNAIVVGSQRILSSIRLFSRSFLGYIRSCNGLINLGEGILHYVYKDAHTVRLSTSSHILYTYVLSLCEWRWFGRIQSHMIELIVYERSLVTFVLFCLLWNYILVIFEQPHLRMLIHLLIILYYS